jgi:hypothetical protein
MLFCVGFIEMKHQGQKMKSFSKNAFIFYAISQEVFEKAYFMMLPISFLSPFVFKAYTQ